MSQMLTVEALLEEAKIFAKAESALNEPTLFGVSDVKSIGSYVEHRFLSHLRKKYEFTEGASISGIDFPQIGVDMMVTHIKEPQSTCPYKSAKQKIFGLGYAVLVFVYEKTENIQDFTGNLNIRHVIFVEKERTADFQTTSDLRRIIENHGNKDDLLAFMQERMLPLDEIQASELAEELLRKPPEIGYLTVSNALHWRLQYGRVIENAGNVPGVVRVG